MRRVLGLELALVILISAAVLLPGISRYSLVDPWETHYSEVARMMRQSHDWVHTQWPGVSDDGSPNEGFRSKPVFQFWMMAASMSALHVAHDGGYSGEMVSGPRIMFAVRLPFVLAAIAGLVLLWWMLARLVSRRLAWLSLLVVGSCPMFCLMSREVMPDMPLCATVMGALALFALALEDGDRPIIPPYRSAMLRGPAKPGLAGSLRRWRSLRWDARHVVLGLTGGFVAVQMVYYAAYFGSGHPLAVHSPHPELWLPAFMLALLAVLWDDGWRLVRLPVLLPGALLAWVAKEPAAPHRAPSRWRHFHDEILARWDRHALDRYAIRALAWPVMRDWESTDPVADRALRLKPITSMRQLYLLGCYSLLGIGVLAKGPPGLAVVGFVGVFYIVVLGKWRDLYEGAFELKRGIALMVATFLPWHLAMFLVEGVRYVQEYLYTHLLDRAAVGDVDKSWDTFSHYTGQLGLGMWLWAALIPAALAATLLRARTDSREGRVRFLVGLWAICGFAFFGIVQTKFHHYILPVVPALALLVAFFLDDILAGRDRLRPLYAFLGIGIVLLVCRDLMYQPERWIEMFVFRYDRPWPGMPPWSIDPSDAFLGLGLAATAALAITPWLRRIGVAAICGVGLAICVWALQVYMPIASTHWGMGDAIRTYYRDRTIYGEKLVYFGAGELADDWRDVNDRWSFDTFIPDALQVGQPMTLTIELRSAKNPNTIDATIPLVGKVRAIGPHTVEVALAPGERAKLAPYVARGEHGPRGRAPVHAVDADRLIAWSLYWRGENFWSAEEINAYLPEMKTSFPASNGDFQKYLNDHTRAPIGRRYFLVTEAGKIMSPKGMLPTQRGRDTYEVIDTTSNKFSLASFEM